MLRQKKTKKRQKKRKETYISMTAENITKCN